MATSRSLLPLPEVFADELDAILRGVRALRDSVRTLARREGKREEREAGRGRREELVEGRSDSPRLKRAPFLGLGRWGCPLDPNDDRPPQP